MHQIIRKAFTLIELLVVIAIIGILSGLIVVSMGGMTQKATIAKAQVFSNSLRNSLMLNLVSEWKFDGSGKNDGEVVDNTYTQDTWGNNNGIINGAPLVRKGNNCVSNSCLFFNPSTDFLTTPTISLSPTAGYTIAFWANLQTKTNGSMPIGDLLAETKSYVWFYSNGNTVQVTGTGEAILIKGDISNFYDGWNYWTFTYDQGKAKLYRNSIITLSNDSASSLVFGIDRIGMAYTTTYCTKGTLDDVRIYNKSIPTSQIKEQYYVGLNKLLASGQVSIEKYQDNILKLSQYSANK